MSNWTNRTIIREGQNMENQVKKVVIIGCARSGLGAVKLAKDHGHSVTLYDKKQRNQFDCGIQEELDKLEKEGVEIAFQEVIDLGIYDLIVVSPGVPLDLPFIQEAIERGQKIVGEFEYASTYCKAPVIAITGTNGKTTTTSLVGEIMKLANAQTFVVGNIGRAFSEDVQAMTTESIAVAEVSSFQLETTQTFHPHIAALLNITPDHLNRHKTMENYIKAKAMVTANQTNEDYLILNKKDAYFESVSQESLAKIIPFHGQEPLDYGVYQAKGKLYANLEEGVEMICEVKDLKIVGAHNVENVLAAIAICKAYGIDNAVIKQGLLHFSGVAHRVEYIGTKKQIDFYNDSKATNTDAAITGLLSMSKPIRLLAGGMDKAVSFKDWIAYFPEKVQKVYVIGECREQIIRECHEIGFKAVEPYDTFLEAIHQAVEEAQAGECVLLSPACASWDMFESYEERGDIFKEQIKQMKG